MNTSLNAAKAWLRDFWRGYSEADVDSVIAKLKAETRPGAIVLVTRRELRAAVMEPRAWLQT
jgi:hypothetical protein